MKCHVAVLCGTVFTGGLIVVNATAQAPQADAHVAAAKAAMSPKDASGPE